MYIYIYGVPIYVCIYLWLLTKRSFASLARTCVSAYSLTDTAFSIDLFNIDVYVYISMAIYVYIYIYGVPIYVFNYLWLPPKRLLASLARTCVSTYSSTDTAFSIDLFNIDVYVYTSMAIYVYIHLWCTNLCVYISMAFRKTLARFARSHMCLYLFFN